jgi:hypothetical protein
LGRWKAARKGQYELQTWCKGRWEDTNLSVLELLLNIADGTVANQAGEGAVRQLGTNLARSGDGTADGAELSNLLCSEITDAFHEGEVVEGDVELADGETGSGGGSDVGVGVEIVGSVLLDEVLKRATEVGEEAVGRTWDEREEHGGRGAKEENEPVILLGDGAGEKVVRVEQVLIVDVESRELELSHTLNLLDVEVDAIDGGGGLAGSVERRCRQSAGVFLRESVECRSQLRVCMAHKVRRKSNGRTSSPSFATSGFSSVRGRKRNGRTHCCKNAVNISLTFSPVSSRTGGTSARSRPTLTLPARPAGARC